MEQKITVEDVIAVPTDGEKAHHVMLGEAPRGFLALRLHVLAKSKPVHLRHIVVVGLALSSLMCIISLAVFLAAYVQAFESTGMLYSYSSPLSSLWPGIGAMWFSAMLILWWVTLCPTFTKAGHFFWAVSGILLALLGFMSLIAQAASKNEGLAAGASLLWIITGATGAAMSIAWLRDPSAADMRPAQWCSFCKCCCSLREWAVGFGVFVQAWMFVFVAGATLQGIIASADYAAYPPGGKIYDVAASPTVTVQMHMWCQGPRDSGKATLVKPLTFTSLSVMMKTQCVCFAEI